MTPPDFGVVALGVALGNRQNVADTVDEYVDDPDRVLRWGYHAFHRAGDGPAEQLGARAANTALTRAGIDPQQLDLVVVANSEVPDYFQWDVSAAVCRALGVSGVPTVLCTQGCAGAATALEHIAGVYATRSDVDAVLLVALNVVSEAHTNRMRFNTCLTSDGAAAALFRRGHPRLRWLATHHVTDPSCVDFFRLEYGGRGAPSPPAGMSNRDINPIELVYEHFRKDPQHLLEFNAALTSRLVSVVHATCARAGTQVCDLSKFLYINDNQRSIEAVARSLGLPVGRTNADIAAEIGHCGAADNLISLSTCLDRDELHEGDVVALAGVSAGMHWYCSLFEV